MKTSKLLRNTNGFTLIELLAAFLIIVIALLGVYIGIVYAEIQIKRNIVERSALLIASGECDYQYRFYRANNKQLNHNRYLPSREVTLDVLENGEEIKGFVSMQTSNETEIALGDMISYKRVSIVVSWSEPYGADKFITRSIVVTEDMFFN